MSPSFDEQVEALIALSAVGADWQRAAVWYEDAVRSKLTEVRESTFSKRVLRELSAWQEEYSTAFPLLTEREPEELAFVYKPFASVVDKLYRLNVLEHRSPVLSVEDCFSSLDDLVRMTLVCPYGDGPLFLSDKLFGLGTTAGVVPRIAKRASDFGYYALHFTFETPVDILALDRGGILHIALRAEIQLTTQLQASLRDITHKIYEVRRLQPGIDTDWKWDFGSPFFQPSYTGHTLHLLESLLVSMKSELEPKRGEGE